MTDLIIPFLGGAATVLIGLWIYNSIINRRDENRFQSNQDKPI